MLNGGEKSWKKKASNITRLLMIISCFCGGEFKPTRKDTLCLENKVVQIIHFKCKLCGQFFYSDEKEKELDWEGLR